VKINRFEWGESRGLVITNRSLQIVKEKVTKRRVAFGSISGISVSTDEASQELVVHVEGSFDCRLKTESKKEILEMLRKVFKEAL